jgi:hypothetical protein
MPAGAVGRRVAATAEGPPGPSRRRAAPGRSVAAMGRPAEDRQGRRRDAALGDRGADREGGHEAGRRGATIHLREAARDRSAAGLPRGVRRPALRRGTPHLGDPPGPPTGEGRDPGAGRAVRLRRRLGGPRSEVARRHRARTRPASARPASARPLRSPPVRVRSGDRRHDQDRAARRRDRSFRGPDRCARRRPHVLPHRHRPSPARGPGHSGGPGGHRGAHGADQPSDASPASAGVGACLCHR